MDPTNRDRITKAFEYLQSGLRPLVERQMSGKYGDKDGKPSDPPADPYALLKVFRKTLPNTKGSLVQNIINIRNRWAHFENFSNSDTERALDSMAGLLAAVSATEVLEINKIKGQLRRVMLHGVAQVITDVFVDGRKGIRINASWSDDGASSDVTCTVWICFYDDDRTEHECGETAQFVLSRRRPVKRPLLL